MNATEIAELAMAGGTLVVAATAVWTMRETRQQVKLLSEQIRMSRAQLVPCVALKEFKFKNDSVRIEIENVSNATAYWLGVKARFYVVTPQYSDSQDTESNHRLSRSQVQQRISEREKVFVRFAWSPELERSLNYEGQVSSPQGAVTYAHKDLPGGMLHSGHSRTINVEPRFAVKFAEGTKSQFLDYQQLRNLMLKQNMEFVGISFSLAYKDLTETEMSGPYIAKFAASVSLHESLEEAWAHHYQIYFLPLSYAEIPWDLEDNYRNMYSSWNVSELYRD